MMKRQHVTISLTATELRALLTLSILGLGDMEGDEQFNRRVVGAAERAHRKLAEVASKNNLNPY